METAAVRKCLGKLLSRQEPALLVPPGVWSPELQREIERLDPGKDPASLAVKSALLLWNDDLTGCHEIAQNLSDEFGAYLHGIMHRREPDYSNAKYWFGRVRQHACFSELAVRAGDLLQAAGPIKLPGPLISRGQWDAFALVDACEMEADAPEEKRGRLLRQVQALEFELRCNYCGG